MYTRVPHIPCDIFLVCRYKASCWAAFLGFFLAGSVNKQQTAMDAKHFTHLPQAPHFGTHPMCYMYPQKNAPP